MITSAPQTLEQFFAPFDQKTFSKGDVLFASDVTPQHAYYIKSGYVRSYTLSSEGVELTIHIFSPHTCFPMMTVLSNLDNRYFYEALTDVEIVAAPKDQVADFITSHTDVLLDFTNRLLRGLDKLTMRIEYLALQSSQKRIISAILFLANHFSTVHDNTALFTYAFTHRDLASFAGVSRETASREWKKLMSEGLVGMDQHFIVIHDIQRLTVLGNI
ncbi:MAG: Crp/Fnr family transcriptional regulator [Chitinophagales bacterium]